MGIGDKVVLGALGVLAAALFVPCPNGSAVCIGLFGAYLLSYNSNRAEGKVILEHAHTQALYDNFHHDECNIRNKHRCGKVFNERHNEDNKCA